MSESIRISPKHGLNPSMLCCPICGNGSSIALVGLLPEDKQAPRNMIDKTPCSNCTDDIEERKKLGFICFVIRDEFEKSQGATPWQFFDSYHVIKTDAAQRMFQGLDLSYGAAFIPLSIAKQIGLKNEN